MEDVTYLNLLPVSFCLSCVSPHTVKAALAAVGLLHWEINHGLYT